MSRYRPSVLVAGALVLLAAAMVISVVIPVIIDDFTVITVSP